MLGVLFALISTASFSFNTVMVRRGVVRASASAGAFVTVLMGVPMFAVAALVSGQLFRAAEAGELTSDEGLRAQAARMLDDPKAATKIRSFHSKLFDLGHYEDVELEGYPEDIGHTLRAEAEAFIDDVLLENDGGIRELYTAPYTYVNEDTAPLYGLEGTYGPELERAGVESDRS